MGPQRIERGAGCAGLADEADENVLEADPGQLDPGRCDDRGKRKDGASRIGAGGQTDLATLIVEPDVLDAGDGPQRQQVRVRLQRLEQDVTDIVLAAQSGRGLIEYL